LIKATFPLNEEEEEEDGWGKALNFVGKIRSEQASSGSTTKSWRERIGESRERMSGPNAAGLRTCVNGWKRVREKGV